MGTLFSCPTESFLSHRISKHCSIPFPVIQANQPKSSFTYCIPQRSTIVSAIRFLYDCDNLCHPPWCGSWYLSTSRPPSTKEATEQETYCSNRSTKWQPMSHTDVGVR